MWKVIAEREGIEETLIKPEQYDAKTNWAQSYECNGLLQFAPLELVVTILNSKVYCLQDMSYIHI